MFALNRITHVLFFCNPNALLYDFGQGGAKSSDLGGFFANADANHLERERIGGHKQTGDLNNTIGDIDPMDMSESMQEAMHRSNLDMRYT